MFIRFIRSWFSGKKSTKQSRRGRRLCVAVCATPVVNIPPIYNVPRELAKTGQRVLIVGYDNGELPRTQRVDSRVRILRVSLWSRRIKLRPLRHILAPLEFLVRCRAVIKRVAPELLITFNDPATILLGLKVDSCRKIAWLLEYPEDETMKLAGRIMFRFSSSFWSSSDIFIAPTQQRLALHFARQPALLSRTALVIQNSPPRYQASPTSFSPRTLEAIQWLEDCRSKNLLTIIHSGAIGDRYGIGAAIQAVGSVSNCALLILGPWNDVAQADVDRGLAAIGSCDRVKWIREVPYAELREVQTRCQAGFVHYTGDTLNTRFSAPGKIYDYLRAGLIIVTDSQACVSTELQASDCAFFFERPASVEGIRNALLNLVERRDEIDAMKSRAIQLFDQQLCLEQEMKQLIAILTEEPQPPQ